MKKVLFLCCILFFTTLMSAQDIIYTINGDSKNVDIFRVDDEKVYYKYLDEDVEYQILKSNVAEIVFKSGRKEVFNVAKGVNDDYTKGTKFSISNPNKEFIVVNENLQGEDHLLFNNFTDKDVLVTVYGVHYETGNIELLSNKILVPSNSKKIRLAKEVSKGRLDHYTAFKICLDMEHNNKYASRILYSNVVIAIWQNEVVKEIELEKSAKSVSFVRPPLVLGVDLIDNKGCTLYHKQLNIISPYEIYRTDEKIAKVKLVMVDDIQVKSYSTTIKFVD